MHVYIYIYIYWLIGLVGSVFTNGLRNLGFNPKSRHTKDFENDTLYLLA